MNLLRPFAKTEYVVCYRFCDKDILDDTLTPFNVLPNNPGEWCADPFIYRHNGELYVFMEIFMNEKNYAGLGYSKLVNGKLSAPKIIIEGRDHLSFPFIFDYNNEIFIMPENCAEKKIMLYRCVDFPEKWEKGYYISDERGFYDTVLFEESGKRYMFTSHKTDELYGSKLYLMELEKSGDTPKIISEKIISENNENSRQAGKMLRKDGKLIRVAQDCSRNEYGRALEFLEIDNLENYSEHSVRHLEPNDIKTVERVFGRTGIHTYNRLDDFEVIDLKIARFYPKALFIKTKILFDIIIAKLRKKSAYRLCSFSSNDFTKGVFAMKKLLSVILAAAVMLPILALPASARNANDFIITNPYKDVDWSKWKPYKTQLHCHTQASDGYMSIQDAITDYYALDYDAVAITDHGTLNKGWDTVPDTIPLVREIKKERTGGAKNPIIPLSAEDYAAYTNGTAKSIRFSYKDRNSNETITTSRKRTHSNGLLDVEKGIELNMATPFADCHLTGYWSDYGQGLAGVFGDYETPSKGVRVADGVSMLAHIGEYVYIKKDTQNHTGQKIDEYYVNKFARIFLDNPGSSVGMGINSATDEHTRCDRILYDQILQKTIPNGVVPWGFSFSDSHSETSINDAYTMMYMPELTNDSLRSCMVNGEFFSVSHYSNGFELNGMKEMENYSDENHSKVEWWKDNTPMVTKLEIDEKKDVIKVWGKNFKYITWVSDGNVIKRDYNCKDGYAEINLHSSKLLDDVNLFVRFYLVGDNGICYSQPMVVRHRGEEFEPVYVPKTYDLPFALRTFVTVLDWILFKWSPIVWIFKYRGLGYNPFRDIFNFDNILSLPNQFWLFVNSWGRKN